MGRKRIEYALYKGDEFIELGTVYEIAKKLKVTPKTIQYYNTPTYKKKVKDETNRRVLVRLGSD